MTRAEHAGPPRPPHRPRPRGVRRPWPTHAHATTLLLTAALVAPLGLPALSAQEAPTPVEQIRLDPDAHLNEIRTVEGVVDRLVRREGSSIPSYYLEDDFGHQIMVIPHDETPERGDRVTVRGVVTMDRAGDPVLTTFDEVDPEAGPSTDTLAVADAEPSGPGDTLPIDLPPGFPVGTTVLIVGAFLGLILVVGYRRSRRHATHSPARPIVTSPFGDDDVDFATSALWSDSDQEFDGRTLRFSRPDPTLQLLPAKLEIIGGADAGEEIRFVAVPGETVSTMFGRSPGEGPHHVQLKQKTVSRTHAIIRHRDGGEWTLENLSMTNPTVLNDDVLGVNETALEDQDRIEMGEVVFRFRKG